jgi:hypothetical protein
VGKFHSKNTFISVDETDISTYADNFALADAADEVEVTGFTDDEKQYVDGFRDIKATISGNYGDADGGGLADLMAGLRDSGETVPIVYGPAGEGAGNVKLVYDGKVLSFDITSAVGAAVKWSSSVRLSNPEVGAFS